MTVEFPYLLCLLCSIIKLSNSQYSPPRNTYKSPCDDANKTSMVEQFFNVMFTEFQHNPPVCICVQMCPHQPTYCYPNGCFNKTDSKKKLNSSPVTHIHQDAASKTMFLVDEKNNFAQILNARAEESVQTSTTTSDFFSDPLRDMYKTFFKYKKMPKVELRYNLREQVKNMKSDILKFEHDDISKTRWPKFNNRVFHDQKRSNDKLNQRKRTDSVKGTFFLSTPQRSPNSNNAKYFKRDLRRNGHVDLDSLMDKPDLGEKDFSIETLIENLIGNTFDVTNDTKVEIRDVVSDSNKNFTNHALNMTESGNDITNVDKIEEVCVVSMNATNENKDENKYVQESLVEEVFKKWSNYTFDEMISELSKRIDIHNNTSLEMMKRNAGYDHSVATNGSLTDSAIVVDVEIIDHKTLKLNNDTINNQKYSTDSVTTEITSKNEVSSNGS